MPNNIITHKYLYQYQNRNSLLKYCRKRNVLIAFLKVSTDCTMGSCKGGSFDKCGTAALNAHTVS